MVPDTFEARPGAVTAQALLTWDWRLALDVALALSGGASRAILFAHDDGTQSPHPLATLGEKSQGPAAEDVEQAEPVASVPASWRLPLQDGAELLGTLYLEYADGCHPTERVAGALLAWARIAASVLKREQAPPQCEADSRQPHVVRKSLLSWPR